MDGLVGFEVALASVNLVVVLDMSWCQVLKHPVGCTSLSVIGQDVVVEGSDVVKTWKAELHDLRHARNRGHIFDLISGYECGR